MLRNRQNNSGIDSEKAYHDQFFKAEAVLDLNMLSFAYNRVFNFLLKYGIPSSQAKILSLGCSKGKMEIAASSLAGRILGVDISGVAIQEAKARSAKLTNVNFLREDVEKLSFSPDSFDSIWALGFLHHLSDRGRERLIYNCKRWLRPGGIFLSIDPSSLRFVNLFKPLFWKSYRKYHSPNERELNIRDTYNIFREAGFDAVQVHYFDYFQIPLGYIFPNLPKTACRLLITLDELLLRVPIVRYFASGFAIVAFNQ